MADADDRIRAIVLTGHGNMFCAGIDLDIGFKGGKEKAEEYRDGIYHQSYKEPSTSKEEVRVTHRT